jgi:hypothetical protein
MHCEACGNQLEPDALIYRVSLGYSHPWNYQKCPGTIIRVCATCNVSRMLGVFPGYKDHRTWWPASSCAHCRRPIIASRNRKPPNLLCCSVQCDALARNAAARRKRRAQRTEQDCDGCGKPFEPKRNDAAFCSPACRQRAYRSRTIRAAHTGGTIHR